MGGVNKKYVLLGAIFVLAFAYRFFLMTWQTYPPGADIGCHTSIINSITKPENNGLLYNFYQMGGGTTLAFPGYHIFASLIITMTGLPSYFAQAIVVSLFSTIIVFGAFLVTRTIWNESTAVIASIFVTISRFDIEMLSWGGYPNLIALFLISIIFYTFLKRKNLSTASFLVLSSVLIASLFLVHSLSSAIFVGIICLTSVVVILFPNLFGESRKNILKMLLPILVGAIVVSPFLAGAAPLYLNESATFAGATPILRVLLADRIVHFSIVLALFVCVLPFFLFSKKIKGQFFSFPVFLLVMWLLVPLLLTQTYHVGFYVDYVRFLYFLMMPVIVLFAVAVDYFSGFFSSFLCNNLFSIGRKNVTTSFFIKLKSRILRMRCNNLYVAFCACFLTILIFFVPIFLFPWEGIVIQSFYQAMNDQGYEGIQWINQNTPEGSVFVSDHDYGWWLGGFAQRPTLSAVNLQSLALAREVDISKNASFLLDTSYMIDNGYIQVREDGGYLGRHNPIFLASLNWNESPHDFFHFNSSKTLLGFRNNDSCQSIVVTDLPVTDMQLVNANTESPSIIVNKANSDLIYSQILTVTKGSLFANLTINVQSTKSNVSLDYLNLELNSQGLLCQSFNNFLLMYEPDMNLFGELLFPEIFPELRTLEPGNFSTVQLSFNLEGKSEAQIQILVAICCDETGSNSQTFPDFPLITFDYEVAIEHYNVSYVANRDFILNPKYEESPKFSLVFENREVCIFQVENRSILNQRIAEHVSK